MFSDNFRRGEGSGKGRKGSKAVSKMADMGWKAFQAVNKALPEGRSIQPAWAAEPLLKSYERTAPPLGFPRETDSLCPACVKSVRNGVISGDIPLDILMDSHSGEIQAEIGKALQGMELPEGYYWDWGTNRKRNAEEFGGMGLAVVLAIGLIYMLLASQFESFVHPFTILLSVPLAATGVILGLFLTGRAFGLTAFIGVLMLVGIVVKNGILLVDYTNVLRARGIKREEALLAAGPTRLRPILMTACAAMLGMLPIAIGIGKGSEIQAPMATAVIGGLLTSTILTLFVVPTVYSVIDDVAVRLRGKR
jgi:multidrug efflux pump subunit AcrB